MKATLPPGSLDLGANFAALARARMSPLRAALLPTGGHGNKRPGFGHALLATSFGVGRMRSFTKAGSMLAASFTPGAIMIGRCPPVSPAAHLRPPQPGMQSSCGDWVIKVGALGPTTLVTPWQQSSA